jgi:hypothetical protein
MKRMLRRGWLGILLLVLILRRLLEFDFGLRWGWIRMCRVFLDVEEQEVNTKTLET